MSDNLELTENTTKFENRIVRIDVHTHHQATAIAEYVEVVIGDLARTNKVLIRRPVQIIQERDLENSRLYWRVSARYTFAPSKEPGVYTTIDNNSLQP